MKSMAAAPHVLLSPFKSNDVSTEKTTKALVGHDKNQQKQQVE
jgi:hypothetical protein